MPTLTIKDNRMVVFGTPYETKDLLKSLPGARWNKAERAWTYPPSAAILERLRKFFGNLTIDGVGWPLIEYLINPTIIHNGEPWPHQRRASQKICNHFATLVAHDMGTGKTKTAIDAIQTELFAIQTELFEKKRA